MAYGLKYYNNYTTSFGAKTTIHIYEDGYSDASEERTLGGNPLTLELFADSSIWKVIRGSSAIIELMALSAMEFSDIFTAENYKYLAIIYRGDSTSELIQNRSFLANSDSWVLSNMTWNNQSIQGNLDAEIQSITQTVNLVNGQEYELNIDLADCVNTIVKAYFDASLIKQKVVATGERFNHTYTWTGATGTAVFKIELTDSSDPDDQPRITNVSLLKSGESHSYNPIFIGHSMQDNYIEPHDYIKYPIQLPFSSGLGNLKNEDFEDAIGNLIGQRQLLDVINVCLQKTRLYLPIYTGIDIYDLDNDSDGDDPIFTKWVNLEVFEDMTCYEVIEECLKCFQVQVKQVYDAWHIVKIANTPYDIDCKIYDSYNNLLDSETVNYVQCTTTSSPASTSDVRLSHKDHQLEIQPAIKKYELTQEYGERLNLINSYFDLDFAWISTTQLRYWSKTTYFSIYSSVFRISSGVQLYGMFKESLITNSTPPGIISPETDFIYDSDQTVKVKISFEYWARYNQVPPVTYSGDSKIGYGLRQIGNSTGWDGTYTNAEKIDIEYTDYNNNDFFKWIKYENEIDILFEDISAGLELKLFPLINTDSFSYDVLHGVIYRNVKVQLITDSDYSNTENVIVNSNNNKTGESIDLTIGDLPDVYYNEWVFQNGLLSGENGEPAIGNWALNGESIRYGSLKDIIREQINYNSATPKQIIRGTIRGNWLLHNILEYTTNDNKRYMIGGVTINDKKSTINGTFIEIYYIDGGLPTGYLKSNSVDYIIQNDGDDYVLISG